MKRLLGIFLAILVVPGVLLAANKNQKNPADKKDKPRPFDKVSSVDVAGNAITITDTDDAAKEYTVNSFTKITVNGKPDKLASVQKGMKVVTLTVGADGKKISQLDVNDPPEEKPEKKKKK